MQCRRVLVLYRKSTYETMALERRSESFIALIAHGDQTVARMQDVHREHAQTLTAVLGVLEHQHLQVTSCERSAPPDASRFDLVVAVGGDGTFLAASHLVRETPVVGVVSSAASVGHFCCRGVTGFERTLTSILQESARPKALARISVSIGEKEAPELVLNEILYAHANPAATSRYILRVGDVEEEQKSSGVWIATAAGSTGAIGSSGGRVLRPTSRRLQFLVREPFLSARKGYRLRRGLIADTAIQIASKMEDGRVFIDGSATSYPVHFGQRVTIRRATVPLTVYGMGE